MAGLITPPRAREFARFLAVGTVSALANTIIIVLLTEIFRLNYLVSYAICFVGVTLFGFVANRSWSFSVDGQANSREAGRYFVVTTATTLIAMAASKVMVELGMSYPVAVFLSAGVMAPLNFVSHRCFSFGLKAAE